MSVFNGERYLSGAIESILKQTLKDFEFIIINDGSTDDTVEIIKSYKDPRIVLHQRSHQGLIASLNYGIKVARGEYIARMDADDISEPERFELEVKFLDGHPNHALVGTTTQIIDTQGRTFDISAEPLRHEEIAQGLLVRNVLAHGSVMFRRVVLHEVGGYDLAALHAEDYDLWVRIARKWKVANLPQPLFKWRLNPHGVSEKKATVQSQTVERIKERQWQDLLRRGAFPQVVFRDVWRKRLQSDPTDLFWRRRRVALAVIYSRLGRESLLRGRRGEATRYVLAALILSPWWQPNYFYLLALFFPKSFLVPAENFFRPIKYFLARIWHSIRLVSFVELPEGGILFVRRGIYPGFDFPEVHQFAEEMVRNGKRVGVACLKSSPSEPSYEEIRGVRVFRLASNTIFFRWVFPFLLLFNLIGRRYDVVHVFWGKGLVFLPSFARHSARRWVLDVRSGHIGGFFSTLFNNGLIILDSYLFDWVITLDERLFRELWRGVPKIEKKVRFVPMGVNGELFRPNFDQKLARKVGIKEGDFTLVYQGTLDRSRRLDRFLQGFAWAKADLPNLRLLIVGGGSNLPNLERIVLDLGAEKAVAFVGHVPYTDVPRYISLGNAGVSYVPQSKTFSHQQVTKTLEYLSCGRPVLATRIPFNEEILTPKLGVLTDDDPQSVAEGIKELARQVKRGKIKVARNVVRHLTWSAIVKERLLPIYNS